MKSSLFLNLYFQAVVFCSDKTRCPITPARIEYLSGKISIKYSFRIVMRESMICCTKHIAFLGEDLPLMVCGQLISINQIGNVILMNFNNQKHYKDCEE